MNRVLTLGNKLQSGKLGMGKQLLSISAIVFVCYFLAIIVNTEIEAISSQKTTVAMYRIQPTVLLDFEEELTRRSLSYQVIYNSDNIPYVDIMFLYGKFSILMVDNIQNSLDFEGGGEIIAGRQPKNSSEVLMNLHIAKNNRLDIGDVYMPNVSGGIGSLGELEVVGLFLPNNNDWRTSYVLKDVGKTAEDYPESLSVGVALSLEEFDAFIEQQGSLVQLFPEGSVEPQSNFGSARQMQNSRNGFILIMGAMFALVFSMVGFCIYHTSSIRLYHRTKEYLILTAMGYTPKQLLWTTYKEYLFINLFGWLFGLLIGTVTIWLLNMFLFIPCGTPALYFSPYGFILTGISALFLCVVNFVPLKIIIGKSLLLGC